MTPKIPKVVVKSLWQYIQDEGSEDAVVEWLTKHQGLDRGTAEFIYARLNSADSFEEFNAFVNDEGEEPVKLTAQEMQMMSAGRAALASASSTSATRSKWPWE